MKQQSIKVLIKFLEKFNNNGGERGRLMTGRATNARNFSVRRIGIHARIPRRCNMTERMLIGVIVRWKWV